MKFEPSQQIFEKSSNIKFHENLSSESRVFPCGRTDGHDKANSRFFFALLWTHLMSSSDIVERYGG